MVIEGFTIIDFEISGEEGVSLISPVYKEIYQEIPREDGWEVRLIKKAIEWTKIVG